MGSTIALLEERLPAVLERRRRAEEDVAAAVREEEAITKALEGLRLLTGTPLGGQREPLADELTPVPAEAAADGHDNAATTDTPEAEPSPVPAAQPVPPIPAARTPRKAAVRKPAVPKAAASPVQEAKASVPRAKKIAKKVAKDTEPATSKRASTATPAAPKKTAPANRTTAEPAEPTAGGRRQEVEADSVLTVLAQAAEPLRAREVTERLGLDTLQGNINTIRTKLERLAKAGRAQRPGRGLYTAVPARSETAG
ncbi:hypothetical protein PUR56_38640 [Streptomyces sp. BE303]|nr:hypothetical protein [Streptomyces sp. BE303]